eukprot:351087-Chlamydomonas_euryale.AAC.1
MQTALTRALEYAAAGCRREHVSQQLRLQPLPTRTKECTASLAVTAVTLITCGHTYVTPDRHTSEHPQLHPTHPTHLRELPRRLRRLFPPRVEDGQKLPQRRRATRQGSCAVHQHAQQRRIAGAAAGRAEAAGADAAQDRLHERGARQPARVENELALGRKESR